MARPRNNLMKLEAATRTRICALLDDGATYDEIRADADIAKECAEKSLVIHNSTFLAYREGVEFDEYLNCRRKWSDDMRRNKIAALFVESGDAPDDIARLANYKLLQICLDKLDSGEDLTEKEVRAISGAVAGYERNRIAQDKEDTKRTFEAEKSEYQAKIAELTVIVQQLTEKLGSIPVDNSRTIAEMDKFAKGE
ncbi:MAG: hypothetical protein PHH77_05295 [Victivallaceae bacterium]|nr:hypothetical protein [Victivallaceae bacterium]